jgi:hypothetical protein
MSAKAIPEGHHPVTPYLCIKGAASALEFYVRSNRADAPRAAGWADRAFRDPGW